MEDVLKEALNHIERAKTLCFVGLAKEAYDALKLAQDCLTEAMPVPVYDLTEEEP